MFRLSKWYLDCTTPEGAAAIGYHATAQWGALKLRYAGLLNLSPGKESATSAWTLLAGPEPERAEDEVSWSCSELGVSGRWTRRDAGMDRTLLEGKEGRVRWACVMPRGSCEFSIGGRTIQGLGYVELLEMTIAPWRLPIRELRWGRWVCDTGSVVWIRWQGEHPLTFIAENGREVGGRVSDEIVELDDGRRLRLETPRVIRDGELGVTALRAIPGLGDVLPRAMLRTRETKWLSRGALEPKGTRGWAIHERVVFGE